MLHIVLIDKPDFIKPAFIKSKDGATGLYHAEISYADGATLAFLENHSRRLIEHQKLIKLFL